MTEFSFRLKKNYSSALNYIKRSWKNGKKRKNHKTNVKINLKRGENQHCTI